MEQERWGLQSLAEAQRGAQSCPLAGPRAVGRGGMIGWVVGCWVVGCWVRVGLVGMIGKGEVQEQETRGRGAGRVEQAAPHPERFYKIYYIW